MQDQENAVFKVPKVKKQRISLYCKETLADLDEIWNCPKGDCKQLNKESVNKHLWQSDAKNDNNQAVDSSDDDEEEDWFNPPEENYTTALLSRFNMYESCPSLTQQGSFAEANGCRISPHTVPQISAQFITDKLNSNKVQDQNVTEILSPKSPDILIVRDESMANADSDSSDDADWLSLTPPMPRSPSDHTVPDLGNIESNIISHDQWSPVSHPQRVLNERIGQPMLVPTLELYSSLDHVVPNFYY
ncbi:uncharacterized protein LOC131953896 [Physella acuta]|uniref:uncharacterized protein LOC131953896 n=1 Tax=Physella acuta TaxID=109671 RepID=UPI0027DC28A5|nr:uncharacterized protein LOC131953896 [Physella acuta]